MSGLHLPVTSPIEDWQAQPHLHDPFDGWFSESKSPPTIGLWALVLMDQEMDCMGPSFHKMWNMPRFSVCAAVCVAFDQEGFPYWQLSSEPQCADGGRRSRYARHVTHYKPIDITVPPDDAPLPTWTLEHAPWRAEDENPAYTNQFGRQF